MTNGPTPTSTLPRTGAGERAGVGRDALRDRAFGGPPGEFAQTPSQVGRGSVVVSAPPAGTPAPCELAVLVRGQVLGLRGRLDVRSAADVRLALADALDAGAGELVLDLSGLDAVDAPGLGVLVGAHRRAGRVGRLLVLRDVPPPVARLLALTRLDRVLRVVRTAPRA